MAAALASREFVQAVLDGLAQHIAVLDREGTIVLVNEAWRRFGRENGLASPQSCLRESYLEACAKAADRQVPFARQAFDGIQAVTEGRTLEFELAYPCPSPSAERWFIMHVTRFESDGLPWVAVVHENITERKRMEDALRSSEQRYRVALANSPVILFNQDAHLRYSWVHNPTLGFRAEEVVGRTDAELLPAEDAAQLDAIKHRVLRSGQPERGEVRTTHRDREGWYDLYVEPRRDGSGRIVGISCAAVDITEQKRAHETRELLMRELEHRLKNLLATAQALVLQTLRSGPLATATADALAETVAGRLRTLGNVQGLLAGSSWRGALLRDLVAAELTPYQTRESTNVIAGDPVLLEPQRAVALGMIVHELATNAVKYGALSVPEGWVEVIWRCELAADRHHVVIEWAEFGGPRVHEPERRGFGCSLIERSASYGIGGGAWLEFPRTGVRCRIEIPLEREPEV
jgi:PAS domain S-box-containing protein